MEYLLDDKCEILWYRDDRSKDSDFVSAELDYWQSHAITKYIIGRGNDIQLGTFSRCASSFDKNYQYFGYINGKLVVTAITRAGDSLNFKDKRALNLHIENMMNGINLDQNASFLSLEKAIKIVDYSNNNDSILYLIVNPKYQGKGYGPRAVSSIKNNLDFFAPQSQHDSLATSIHIDNYPSISAFDKNDFKKLNIMRDVCMGFLASIHCFCNICHNFM